MTEITDFVKDCNTVKDVFDKAKASGMQIRSINIRDERFVPIETRADYALVKLNWIRPKKPCGGYISTARRHKEEEMFVHPYGSSIGYEVLPQ